jgi:head-tail adaptor
MSAGTMTELLVIQENAPEPFAVSSLTRASTTATATTSAPHGYATNDFVQIAGATPSGYDGKFKITVTGPSTFTYLVNGTLATPATGTITALYVSDAQGNRKIGWEELESVAGGIAAELVQLSGVERLQAQALSSQVDYRFRVYARGDITASMRALWTPSRVPNAVAHTLEIRAVELEGNGGRTMLIEASEVAA